MGGQRYAPAAVLQGKTRYPSYRRPQGRSGQMQKTSPPPGFVSGTVQILTSEKSYQCHWTVIH